MARIFRPFFGLWASFWDLKWNEVMSLIEEALRSRAWNPLLCRYSSGLGIAKRLGMLSNLNRRYAMSPLMLMLLLSLVPFPILAIAIVVDRCLKSVPKTIS